MKKKDYAALCKRRAARSPLPRNSVAAFLVGGAICLAGEALRRLYLLGVAEEKTAALLSTVTLVAVSAILTGVGVYDTLARVAGAGTLVPVTGFANAVVSPALDTRAEGLVVGIGAKIFTVAGPVLLYAVLAGAVYGGLYLAVGEVMAWLGF